MPIEAFGLLAAHRLDRDLFDVTALLEDEYDDASRGTLPVMVDYGTGRTAAAESRERVAARPPSAPSPCPSWASPRSTPTRSDARAFWADLTKGADAAGNPTALADGAARVDLDGRVEVVAGGLGPADPRPEAWAAGFDGTGATVAVLDTGYDPTHPDLAGPGGRRRPTSPPTPPSPTATATAPTWPRPSAAAAPPPTGCARAWPPAPT